MRIFDFTNILKIKFEKNIDKKDKKFTENCGKLNNPNQEEIFKTIIFQHL